MTEYNFADLDEFGDHMEPEDEEPTPYDESAGSDVYLDKADEEYERRRDES